MLTEIVSKSSATNGWESNLNENVRKKATQIVRSNVANVNALLARPHEGLYLHWLYSSAFIPDDIALADRTGQNIEKIHTYLH